MAIEWSVWFSCGPRMRYGAMMALYGTILVALFAYDVAASGPNGRFYISDDKVPYFTALDICRSLNMRLIGPESDLDTIFGSTVFPEAVDYAVSDAGQFEEMRMKFWYLTSKEPGPEPICNQIIMLYDNGERDIRSAQDICLKPKRFICENPNDKGGLISGFAVSTQIPLTFMEAAKACSVHNKQLAYVHSEMENRELTQKIRSETDSKEDLFWLGGIHIKTNRDFRWFPSNKYIVYSNWEQNVNLSKNRGCIAMAFNQADLSSLWVAIPCSRELPFICRRAHPKRTALQVWIPNPEKKGLGNEQEVGMRTFWSDRTEAKRWLRQTIHGLFYGFS